MGLSTILTEEDIVIRPTCSDRALADRSVRKARILYIDEMHMEDTELGYIATQVMANRKGRAVKIIYKLPPNSNWKKLLDTCLRAGDGEGFGMRTEYIEDTPKDRWLVVDFTPEISRVHIKYIA